MFYTSLMLTLLYQLYYLLFICMHISNQQWKSIANHMLPKQIPNKCWVVKESENYHIGLRRNHTIERDAIY